MNAVAEATIEADAARVYGYLADYVDHHDKVLPPAFSGFTVRSGGVGAGTVVCYRLTAGGRQRDYEMTVAEPEPGRVITESDAASSLVTTYSVTPVGADCRVRISTSWQGAGGIGGFFERRFAPRALGRLYRDELALLRAYAARRAAEEPPSTT